MNKKTIAVMSSIFFLGLFMLETPIVKAANASTAKKCYESYLKGQEWRFYDRGDRAPEVVKYPDINGDGIPELTVYFHNGWQMVASFYNGKVNVLGANDEVRQHVMLYREGKNEILYRASDSPRGFICAINPNGNDLIDMGDYVESEHDMSGAKYIRDAQSDNTVVYENTCSSASTFEKTNDSLSVVFKGNTPCHAYNSADESVIKSTKKLKLKIDKNCIWTQSNVLLHESLFSKKISYKKIKNVIEDIRSKGEWEAGLRIYVKKNKVIRVDVNYS